MIYDNNDNHPIINELKLNGWVIFEVMYARPSFEAGICSGWWIDCATTYNTEYYETHKSINNKFLGITIKESIKTIRDNKFPKNKIK